MKSRIIVKVSILISFTLLSITACSRSALEPTPNLELIVARTQTSMALDQLLTSTSVVITQDQTQSLLITNTPPEFTPTPAEIECKDQAELISETIPPGTTGPRTVRLVRLRALPIRRTRDASLR